MRPNISEELCAKAGELIKAGCDGLTIVARLTDVVDNMLFTTFQLVVKDPGAAPLALVAVGGYGRRELAPYSDVDIMLLAANREPVVAETAQAVLYRFWDMGLNISHCFRTLNECVEDATADIKTRTSLIESRFLAGSRDVFDEYKRDVYQKLLFKGKKEFIADKLREIDKRHRTYGDSIYLLEPNVKEGRGGLRDIHSILWLAKVVSKINGMEGLNRIMSDREYRYLVRAYDFFLRVRLCLHVLSQRKNDVLSFEYQGMVSSMTGLKDTARFLSAEILMRLYYKKAKNVTDALAGVMNFTGRRYISFPFDFTLRRMGDFYLSVHELGVRDKGVFRDSDRILEAFYLFSKTGRKFGHQTREAIKSRFMFINKKARSSGKAIGYFLQVLGGGRVYETLREMHETGILDRFIPEFGRLRHLVVYEPYHRYTVDEHTLTAVKNLENLKSGRNTKLSYLCDVMRNVKQEVLFLAVLLHDIGKSMPLRYDRGHTIGHEEAGYKLIKKAADRFNLGGEDRQRIEFLVKNHVLLSRLVLTRDADAPETITQIAEAVESEDNLNALYLMTYADMSAVNPEFWTEWKAYLFHDVYTRTRDHLRGVREGRPDIPDKKLKGLVEDMPFRYLISNTFSRISSDNEMAVGAREKGLSVSFEEQPDGTAGFTLVTKDMPGLFLRIVSVLGRFGLNILRARLYTGKSGLVIDRFVVSNWKDLWWLGMEEQIREELGRAIINDRDASCVKRGAYENKTRYVSRITHHGFGSFIEVDNETSAECTILEMFSTDRIGLLYDISSRFYGNNVDIISAIINTEEGLAQDVFYLQSDGGKLDAEITFKILTSVYDVIDYL